MFTLDIKTVEKKTQSQFSHKIKRCTMKKICVKVAEVIFENTAIHIFLGMRCLLHTAYHNIK